MTKTRIQAIAIYTIVALGALFGVLFLRMYCSEKVEAYIVSDSVRIPVSIADTSQERERGLSGTTSLAEGTGKLFVFDVPDTYAFWMKDMRYPIDVVWIDTSWKVVDIMQALTPESYPTAVSPSAPAQYVLEINAGEAARSKISIGVQLMFQQ